MPGGGRALYRAREEERDQSYFLFGTTREQLDILRFPLGERTKAETRELARRFGLAIADKHDSQDICFVPSGHYADMIERLKPGAAEAGDIVDLDGKVLGAHAGIIHFTVGQRRGLGVATGAPLYVVRLDAERRRVVVGPREALRMSRIVLRDVNWIGEGSLDEALADDRREVFVKVRSTRPPQAAWLRHGADGCEVELVDGEHGVSPGQACVFYDAGEGQARVLGGGFIKSCGRGGGFPARRKAGSSAGDAQLSAAAWGLTSTNRASNVPMRGGRPSMIWYSARCSILAGAPRSSPPSRHAGRPAGVFSRSASAPEFRYPTTHEKTGWSASIYPNRCCAKRTSVSPNTGSAMSRRWR